MTAGQSTALPDILKAQYHAGMRMLREAIEACPPAEWHRPDDRNPSWQMAYHTLFYTHMYLQPSLNRFTSWGDHKKAYAALGDPQGVAPPSRDYVLAYWDFCDGSLDGWVDSLDLDAAGCGFWWYEMGKLEHQLVNLRHLQHHAAQLAERLRQRCDVGVSWAASG